MRLKKIKNYRVRLLDLLTSLPFDHVESLLIGEFKTGVLYLFEMRMTLVGLSITFCLGDRFTRIISLAT